MNYYRIVTLHLSQVDEHQEEVSLFGHTVEIRHMGCHDNLDEMVQKIEALDGQVDAIALQDVPRTLRLGTHRTTYRTAGKLFATAEKTPVVDGSGIRDAMERWAICLAAEKEVGIWSRKRVLMVPGLNHTGLSQALSQYTAQVRYTDPIVFLNLPSVLGVGSSQTLKAAAGPTLTQLKDVEVHRLFPTAGEPKHSRSPKPFQWADVIAGNMGTIRRYAPQRLKRKTIVTEYATVEDVADLTERGASVLVTTMPALGKAWATMSGSTLEACLAALRLNKEAPLTENTYLNLMAELEWTPTIRHLQAEEERVNTFAFVIHPLSIQSIHTHPQFRFTKYLPDQLVEPLAALLPPLYMSKIKGIESPTTGQKVEGHLLALGATPKEFMRRDAAFTYRRLIQASHIAERLGARLMGLGAFTSVVGDAGITVARNADIAITSGNSLTVSATLEITKEALVKMGHKLENARTGTVMVIGATGSIGAVCSRLLAQVTPNVILVAPRPEKLIALKRTIEEETPDTHIRISTQADDYVGEADLIVTTTTAIGQRIIDIVQCKPGAVICDIARPPDITEEEAALRPDVLVIESGEILLPGEPDFGYDIGLPAGVAYACLAETALLALEGRFEDYTLGRDLEVDKVKEIYRLYKKHQLKLSGIRSHGRFLTDADLAHKRALADELRSHPDKLAQVRREGAKQLAALDAHSGRTPHRASPAAETAEQQWLKIAGIAFLTIMGLWIIRLLQQIFGGRRQDG